MKITSTTTNISANKEPESNKSKAAARGTSQASEAAGEEERAGASSGTTEGRDFASVLEDVSRPNKEQRHERDSEGDGDDAKRSEKAERDGVERREDRREREGGSGRGFGGNAHGGVREITTVADATSARAILHIADLERIVSAVRTQLVAGGRHEVTIDLRRSVLEGLRVRLTTGADGRITAEFLASSERVRAQLDARSGELAEIMRGRGVNLASLQTSVAADTSSQDSANWNDSRGTQSADAAARSHAATQPVDDDSTSSDTRTDDSTGTTYRA